MKEYSIKDLSLEFGVSERTILRQIQTMKTQNLHISNILQKKSI